MAKELDSVDISDVPEMLHLAEEVHKSNEPRILTRNHEQPAVIMPLRQPRRRGRRTDILTRDDPFVRMAGTGDSGIPGGISGRKYEYFRRAFRVEEHTGSSPGPPRSGVCSSIPPPIWRYSTAETSITSGPWPLRIG